MADPKKELQRLINSSGGVLIRWKNHNVYKFPSGLVFTVAKTPDSFGFFNALKDLRRRLAMRR